MFSSEANDLNRAIVPYTPSEWQYTPALHEESKTSSCLQDRVKEEGPYEALFNMVSFQKSQGKDETALSKCNVKVINEKIILNNGEVLPLPHGADKILNYPSPSDKEKKTWETHNLYHIEFSNGITVEDLLNYCKTHQ